MRHECLQLVRKQRITSGKRHANAQCIEWYRRVPGGCQAHCVFFSGDKTSGLLCVDRSYNGPPIFLRVGVMIGEHQEGHHLRSKLCEYADKRLRITNPCKSYHAALMQSGKIRRTARVLPM